MVDLNAKATKDGDALLYEGTTVGSPLAGFGVPSCSAGGQTSPAILHRYTTGASPARVTFESIDVGGALDDTILSAYLDCLNTSAEHACDDDSGDGPLSRLRTGVLPPNTPVFLVVAGYDAMDAGPYSLRITEKPFVNNDVSGTCDAPTPAGAGSFGGQTLASDGATLSASCTGAGPEAVYALDLPATADVLVRLMPDAPLFDAGVYLVSAPCTGGTELACADSETAGAAESFSLDALPPGQYFVVVDGYTGADVGAYGLEIAVRPVIALGSPCDLGASESRCTTGASCVDMGAGPICAAHTALLSNDFVTDLGTFTVADAGNDGKGFRFCNPAAGCSQENITGSVSAGAFALVKDEDGASLDGEALVSAPIDASAYTKVLLELDHDFDHWTAATDVARIEVSVSPGTWIPVATYTADASGHVRLDLSAHVAGKSFTLRLLYDDQTAGGDGFAEEWRIDDVKVYGL